jgi:hypothetical protein
LVALELLCKRVLPGQRPPPLGFIPGEPVIDEHLFSFRNLVDMENVRLEHCADIGDGYLNRQPTYLHQEQRWLYRRQHAACLVGCLGAATGAELGQDRRHVMVDRAGRNEQPVRNLGIGEVFHQE